MSAVRFAMWRLGLHHEDVLQMRADLLAAIARANNDLIHGFRKTGSTAGFHQSAR